MSQLVKLLKFRIRSLFLAATSVAIVYAVSDYMFIAQCRCQSKAVANVRKNGGKVEFSRAVKPAGELMRRFEQKTGMLLSNYVIAIDLSESKITSRELDELIGLDTLYILDVSQTAITDGEMESISRMKHLRTLDLSGTNISDLGLERIASMQSIYRVNVKNTSVSKECIAKLRSENPRLDIVP